MTTTKTRLAFGYNAGLPEGCAKAWGARWIWPADQVAGRTDWLGTPEETQQLMDWLNGSPDGGLACRVEHAQHEARRLAGGYELTGSEVREVTLYEDETGVIKANPNKSYGYLYVVAYLKGDA